MSGPQPSMLPRSLKGVHHAVCHALGHVMSREAHRARAPSTRPPRRCRGRARGAQAPRASCRDRMAHRGCQARPAGPPDGRRRGRQYGHVAGERLQHGQPKSLALGRHENRVGSVDPQGNSAGLYGAEREQLDLRRGRERDRAVVALLRGASGRREQQVGPVGVQAQRGTRLRARQRVEALHIHAAGQHCARRDAAPGNSCASGPETAASRSMSGSTARVARRVRGWLRSCRAPSARARGRERRGPARR